VHTTSAASCGTARLWLYQIIHHLIKLLSVFQEQPPSYMKPITLCLVGFKLQQAVAKSSRKAQAEFNSRGPIFLRVEMKLAYELLADIYIFSHQSLAVALLKRQ
jgi:hypothetical protein